MAIIYKVDITQHKYGHYKDKISTWLSITSRYRCEFLSFLPPTPHLAKYTYKLPINYRQVSSHQRRMSLIINHTVIVDILQ